MLRRAGFFVLITAVMAISGIANATLIDRGNGMIYDDVQNITWLQDANYAQTSGYDADGRMTWDTAMSWAEQLSYGGFDDWRLASASPTTDTSCSGNMPVPGFSTIYYGTDCIGSELGHMFYVDLGLLGYQSIMTTTDPDINLFININANDYWTDIELASITDNAWTFSTSFGTQYFFDKDIEYYAWAVRDGDVAAVVPEPLTALLLGMGLFGMFVTTKTNANKHKG